MSYRRLLLFLIKSTGWHLHIAMQNLIFHHKKNSALFDPLDFK
jgi:hypothetical protein